MSKLNKKGFALVETLVVSVFVVSIFTMMYINFFPMMGEYERREGYDDVDSIYRTYLIKKMLESNVYKTEAASAPGSVDMLKRNVDNAGDKYFKIFNVDYDFTGVNRENRIKNQCSALVDLTYTNNIYNYCVALFTETKVTNVYLTTYDITELKTAVKNGDIGTDEIDQPTQDYIDTLAYYKKGHNDCEYRIIVEYVNEINKESEEGKRVVYSFSTMGVIL